MRVAILLKGRFSSSPEDQKRKKQQEKTARAVEEALNELGFEVFRLYFTPPDFSPLINSSCDVIFNLYAATGREQALVAGLLELSGVPFTGSTALGHFLALGKHIAKAIWKQNEIPTPSSFFPPDPREGDFPLIVKPAYGGSGEGISSSSIVRNLEELEQAIRRGENRSPLLIEKFIPGKELTIGLLGNPPHVLPPLEVSFDRLPKEVARINSFEAKTTYSDLVEVKPACLPGKVRLSVEEVAFRAFQALGLRDYARCDIRLDESGNPYVLEINSLPGLEPGYSDLPRAAEAASISYKELIARIIARCL
ncbi:MAG: ATP-grasp domain-containing protein [Caldiserica bacterium]|jgi:D-alanine-D-alanine ligase|nr:ATP-grasp domain-containing protein [Caldisericota bacterium]